MRYGLGIGFSRLGAGKKGVVSVFSGAPDGAQAIVEKGAWVMKMAASMVVVSTLILSATSVYGDMQPRQGMGAMGQSSGMMMQGGGMGMMDMNRAQERFKSMQQLMDRMHSTTDAGKRRSLMREHMQEMQAFMGDMRGMMMGPGMQGGGKGMSMDDRQQVMEQRLNLMQQMMEQMMEQQSQMMR